MDFDSDSDILANSPAPVLRIPKTVYDKKSLKSRQLSNFHKVVYIHSPEFEMHLNKHPRLQGAVSVFIDCNNLFFFAFLFIAFVEVCLTFKFKGVKRNFFYVIWKDF